MKNKIFAFILFWMLPLFTSAQDASIIISKCLNKLNQVQDYTANASIKSDIPFIKILTVKATVYFKQKDHFRIISKGIAVLPKQGFTNLSKLLNEKEKYSAIYSGKEMIEKTNSDIITILPNGDTSDLILVKLWIDPEKDIIRKAQITTISSGTIVTEYQYGSQTAFGLPDHIVFTVDAKKFKIPKGIATDINRSSTPENSKTNAKTGKIYVQLSDYQINKGIKDDVFIR